MVDLLREEATSLIADLGRALEGRYVIGDALGSGRGGITVRAERVASGRTVALKVAWNDPVARERVWREMVLTSEAKHLNVLPMRPVEAPDSMVVVEMPLASGGTVDDLLNTRTPVPYARTLDIVRAVASALEQAHSKGIVHGALAPE
jgi:serine/threonine protein kinase